MIMDNFIDWYDAIDTSNDVELISYEIKLDFALALENLLERNNVSKSKYASEIKSSPAYVSKVLRGDANLTIDSMVKLADALGHAVHIHLAPKDAVVRWFNIHTGQTASKLVTSKNAARWKNAQGFHNEPIQATA